VLLRLCGTWSIVGEGLQSSRFAVEHGVGVRARSMMPMMGDLLKERSMLAGLIAKLGVPILSPLYKVRRKLMRPSPASRSMQARGAVFYDAVWLEAARLVGVPARRVGHDVLEIDAGGTRLRVCGNRTSFDDLVTVRVAGDKALVHRLLEEKGIPVPRHMLCTAADVSDAWAFHMGLGCPVVVKPARSTSGGDGVTTGIRSRDDLVRAMALAGSMCDDVIVEELLEGENYRLLYFDGELLDAVLRSFPCLEGDGTSTLSDLIRRENHSRLNGGLEAGQFLLDVDSELKGMLREQGYTLRSVPPKGQRVRLARVVSRNRGTDNQAVHHSLCDSLVETGAEAVRALGMRLAGVDLVTPDASLPLDEAGGAIIEVNTTPNLYYHYVRRGDPAPVARRILERLASGG
jgi:D-alanine-D-alanine ligase-like ATP-grasp enzyme